MENEARNIFIETSIQIERILGRIARKEQIRETLEGAKVSTSSYVWMEFRRTALQAMAYLLTIIRLMQQEGETYIRFSELMKRVAAGTAIGYSRRVLQRVLLAYGYILETFPRSPVRATTLIDYLEFNIEHVIPARFFQGINEVIKNTDCDLVRPNVPVGDYFHNRLSCNAATAQCSLVYFLVRHRSELLALEHALAQAEPNQINPSTLAALRRVNKDVTKAKGERTCWALSDVIIALEAPDDALIYTTDNHFDVICAALGKRRFVESS
jgi:hypothetical protein